LAADAVAAAIFIARTDQKEWQELAPENLDLFKGSQPLSKAAADRAIEIIEASFEPVTSKIPWRRRASQRDMTRRRVAAQALIDRNLLASSSGREALQNALDEMDVRQKAKTIFEKIAAFEKKIAKAKPDEMIALTENVEDQLEHRTPAAQKLLLTQFQSAVSPWVEDMTPQQAQGLLKTFAENEEPAHRLMYVLLFMRSTQAERSEEQGFRAPEGPMDHALRMLARDDFENFIQLIVSSDFLWASSQEFIGQLVMTVSHQTVGKGELPQGVGEMEKLAALLKTRSPRFYAKLKTALFRMMSEADQKKKQLLCLKIY
jgi:hypothetical protein